MLERVDQPLAVDLPLIREVRAALGRCMENGRSANGHLPYPAHASYRKMDEMPPLYSGSFGLGSRDLQPEGLIGAVENMLPAGAKKNFFYLSIDFAHDRPFTPKQEIHQIQVTDSYPGLKELAVHGSENPNLMPDNSITVRLHSVGGWGAITTGKNLAMTLFDLLGYHIKANPKYGSEKKGQPTTYYLSAAPEPIRINCDYFYVDVVLSPDPNVFQHSNPLAGLKKGGIFILQSAFEKPEDVWAQIPERFQRIIVENNIRVFFLDAFKIAREEANDPELQFRMQGIAFQGAFFATSPVMSQAKLDELQLFGAIRSQLEHKFGTKGARVVEDNIRVVRRGFDEVHEIPERQVTSAAAGQLRKAPELPVLLKHLPGSATPTTDIHRFWEQTGSFYLTGRGNDNLADPFIGLSLIPAATGVFRDMTGVRFDHPQWMPENCTACGACYTICPDSAIPGLVHSIIAIFGTAVKQVAGAGHNVKHLFRAVRTIEPKFRSRINEAGEKANVRHLLDQTIAEHLSMSPAEGAEKTELEQEFQSFREALGDFQFAVTAPFWTVREKKQKGTGGLLSITVNPYTCKGCMECVKVCNDDALRPIKTRRRRRSRISERTGSSGRPCPPRSRIHPHRESGREDRRAGNAAARQEKLPRHGRRRRRLPRMRRKNRRPSVHRHRRSAHAAARREAGRKTRRPDRQARPAHPPETGRHDRPERQRQGGRGSGRAAQQRRHARHLLRKTGRAACRQATSMPNGCAG